MKGNIQIKIGGRLLETEPYHRISTIFRKNDVVDVDCHDYHSNPIVGAVVNGQAQSLSYVIQSSSSVDPIYAFDNLGRRIYRHSLSLLLSYAAYKVVPERNLIIGHSLGDGFYFFFDDDKGIGDELLESIRSTMEEIVSAAITIRNDLYSNEDAVRYFESIGKKQTVLLLKSRNDAELMLYSINDYKSVSYEPIVPNTAILSVWKLVKYGDGLLLRYPVSSSVKEIVPFRDNPLLFSVFREYAHWGKILGVRSLGEMNRKNVSGGILDYVRLSEDLHRRKIASIADSISRKEARIVFIAGPSSSGKTTFAKRLCEQLTLLGYKPFKVSLDDYYNPPDMAPKDEKGEPDLEALEALNLQLIDDNMSSLVEGKPVHLPSYSFTTHETTFSGLPVQMDEKTIVVVEGIHALNNAITDCIDPRFVFKVYISALTQLNLDDNNRVSTSDNRLLRRIIRDFRTRGSSAYRTLHMWPSVTKGESRNIFPHQNNADVMFNSALDYEIGVLAPFAQPLLRAIGPEEGEEYALARRLLAFLDNVYPIPASLVPSDSLLREFIGQSDYE